MNDLIEKWWTTVFNRSADDFSGIDAYGFLWYNYIIISRVGSEIENER